jgi:hypothetical protein
LPGKFLLNNYKQALELLDGSPSVMAALSQLGATSTAIVEEWLEEEGAYLQALKKEPLEETLEMEYYKVVLSLRDSE